MRLRVSSLVAGGLLLGTLVAGIALVEPSGGAADAGRASTARRGRPASHRQPLASSGPQSAESPAALAPPRAVRPVRPPAVARLPGWAVAGESSESVEARRLGERAFDQWVRDNDVSEQTQERVLAALADAATMDASRWDEALAAANRTAPADVHSLTGSHVTRDELLEALADVLSVEQLAAFESEVPVGLVTRHPFVTFE